MVTWSLPSAFLVWCRHSCVPRVRGPPGRSAGLAFDNGQVCRLHSHSAVVASLASDAGLVKTEIPWNFVRPFSKISDCTKECLMFYN